jgi:hypothetical protein
MCGRQELSYVSLNITFMIDFVPFSLMQASVITYLHLSVNWIICVTYKVDVFNINMSIESWTQIKASWKEFWPIFKCYTHMNSNQCSRTVIAVWYLLQTKKNVQPKILIAPF